MHIYYKFHEQYHQLNNYASTVFEEIAGGIYYIYKDRSGKHENRRFASQSDVAEALNTCERVAVKRLNRDYISNFDVYKEIRNGDHDG